MEITTKFNLGSIIKLNKEKAVKQLKVCLKRIGSGDDAFKKYERKTQLERIDAMADKKFKVVKIAFQPSPYTGKPNEVVYDFEDITGVDSTPIQITNRSNESEFFHFEEDLFEEVK